MPPRGADASVRLAPSRRDLARLKFRGKSGLAVSVLTHFVAIAGLVWALTPAHNPSTERVIVPLEVVKLASEASTPRTEKQAAIPQQAAAAPSSPAPQPTALAPSPTRPPPDVMEIKLRRLSQLRQPLIDQDLAATGDGLARVSTTRPEAAPGSDAALKDFLRDQIEHHWSVDLSELHHRAIWISLRLKITRAGVVASAAVIREGGIGVESDDDEVALSARNAALMSSPLTLPSGHYPAVMDLIIELNTQDALK